MSLTKVSYSMVAGADYNILDYGSNIQAAIDAAYAAGGGQVIIPAGTYNVTTPIVPKSKVSIIGQGIATVLQIGSNSCFSISKYTYASIKNLYIYSTDPASGNAFDFPLAGEANLSTNIVIQGVRVRGCNSAVRVAAGAVLVVFAFKDCVFDYNRNWHVLYENGANINVMSYINTRFEQNGDGVGALKGFGGLYALGEHYFECCVFEALISQYAVYIEANPYGFTFVRCHFEANSILSTNGADIYIGIGSGNVVIDSCSFGNPYLTATNFYNIIVANSNIKVLVTGCNVAGVPAANYTGFINPLSGIASRNILLQNNSVVSTTFDYLPVSRSIQQINNSRSQGYLFGKFSENINKYLNTTNATPTALWNEDYSFVDSKVNAVLLYADVCCTDSGGAGTVYGAWSIKRLITTNSSNTATSRGNMDATPISSGGTLACNVTITNNGSGSVGLSVTCTGVASTNIKWAGKISIQQVSFS